MLPQFLRTVLSDIDQMPPQGQSAEVKNLATILRDIDASQTRLNLSCFYSLVRHPETLTHAAIGETFELVPDSTGRTFSLVPYPGKGTKHKIKTESTAIAYKLIPYPTGTGKTKTNCPKCGHEFEY
jgi:hypothetical protein